VFFCRRKPDTVQAKKPNPERRQTGEGQHSSPPGPPDGDDGDRALSSRARDASRPTTYVSWSSSHQSPTAPENGLLEKQRNKLPEKCATKTPSPCPSPHSSLPSGECSPTPEHIRQSLTETGIYRTLSALGHRALSTVIESFERSSEDRHLGGEGIQRRTGHGTSTEPSANREHLAKQAYVTRQSVLSQLPEEPPPPPDKPRPPGTGDSGTQPVTRYPYYEDNQRHRPLDRSQAQRTCPAARTAVSPTPSGIPSHFRSRAAMGPPPRPPSRFRYATPVVRPHSTQVFGRAGHALGRPPYSLASKTWLPHTSPNIYNPPETSVCQPLPSRHVYSEQRLPEVYESEYTISPLRPLEKASIHDYIGSLEQKSLWSDHENHPPTAASTQASQQGPYLKPFFRHGAAAGIVPTFNVYTPAQDPYRPPAHSLSNPLGIVSQTHSGQPFRPLGIVNRQESLPENNAQYDGRWQAGYEEQFDESTDRYWKPNTHGL